MLTFASGGWVIVAAIALVLLILGLVLVPATRRMAELRAANMDESNGFDLSFAQVPVEEIRPAQLRRDLIPALIEPDVIRPAQVETLNQEIRGKYLVPSDVVIGVVVNNEARAYPLLVLNSHEVVNDTLGEVPIVVNWNPICGSALVFERTVAGETLTFGVSGLVYNANQLLYDRRPNAQGESLWSQLQARAVTGPAAEAGHTLAILPAELAQWDDWKSRHPATTVLASDEQSIKRYREINYASYFQSDELFFPVSPAPSASGPEPKTPCVILLDVVEPSVFTYAAVLKRVDEQGRWTIERDGAIYTFHTLWDPVSIRVTVSEEGNERPARVAYALWFAWHAMHPNDELFPVDDGAAPPKGG